MNKHDAQYLNFVKRLFSHTDFVQFVLRQVSHCMIGPISFHHKQAAAILQNDIQYYLEVDRVIRVLSLSSSSPMTWDGTDKSSVSTSTLPTREYHADLDISMFSDFLLAALRPEVV